MTRPSYLWMVFPFSQHWRIQNYHSKRRHGSRYRDIYFLRCLKTNFLNSSKPVVLFFLSPPTFIHTRKASNNTAIHINKLALQIMTDPHTMAIICHPDLRGELSYKGVVWDFGPYAGSRLAVYTIGSGKSCDQRWHPSQWLTINLISISVFLFENTW